MVQWEEIQAKAKKLIDEGFRLLRMGIGDAEYLAEATANAAKLHMAVRRNRLDKYRLLHEVGEEVCNTLMENPTAREIQVTQSITDKIARAHSLDEEAKRAEERIANLTVIKQPESPNPPDNDD
jgi:hypothetical protein